MLNLALLRHPWNWFVVAFWLAIAVLLISAAHSPNEA
jgi:hypothetical protein